MTHPGEITRRQLLRRIGMTALVAGPGAGLLSACATGGASEPAAPTASAAASTSPANPFGVDAKAPLKVTIFGGGYGDAYAKEVHEELYKKAFAGVTIQHNATQQIGTQLRPLFVSPASRPASGCRSSPPARRSGW